MYHLLSQCAYGSARTLSALIWLCAWAGVAFPGFNGASAQDVFKGTYEIVENGPNCTGAHDTQLRVHLDAQKVTGDLWPTDSSRGLKCYQSERRGLKLTRIQIPCSDQEISEFETRQIYYSRFERAFSVSGSFGICAGLWNTHLVEENLAVTGTFEGEDISLQLPKVDPLLPASEQNIWAERLETRDSIYDVPRVVHEPGLILNLECIELPKPEDVDVQAFAVISVELALSETEPEACGVECFSQVRDDGHFSRHFFDFYNKKCLEPDAGVQGREVEQ